MTALPELPPTFAATRDGLHRLACFVIAPARKARTGRIGLRPTGDGFGTPPFDDGSRVAVRGDELLVGDVAAPITTLRAAAALAGVVLAADPGVGADLPPFEPDADLAVDASASRALGAWYAFGGDALARLAATATAGATVGEAQLWPEHFDLAVVVELPGGAAVNVGVSPGDGFSGAPYVYVGPHEMAGLAGAYWNAPFGAVRTVDQLASAPDPAAAVDAFVADGLQRVAARPRGAPMLTPVTPAEIAGRPELADWRVLLRRLEATFRCGSYRDAVQLVVAIAEAAEAADHHPDIDVRYPDAVHVVLTTHAAGGRPTELDARLAAEISTLAAAAGARSEPTAALACEIAIDALDIDAVRPFWQAVLGYVPDGAPADGSPVTAITDPARIGPPVWFQQMDEPRSQRNRIHVDVTVAHDVAAARVDAALAAGGRLVSDADARAFWVLADPEGNEACVCTWQDRG